jgi:hypothetical protein
MILLIAKILNFLIGMIKKMSHNDNEREYVNKKGKKNEGE